MTRRRIPLETALTRPLLPPSFVSRPVTPKDREALAILLYAAYRGTIDDEGDSFADALGEIEKTFRGDYGRFLPGCSFVVDDGEFLASACLVSFFAPHDAPLVIFLMTRPEAQRHGLARGLLARSMSALREVGYDRLTLIVTDGNVPAQRLYASLGFRPIDEHAAQGGAPA